MSKRGLLPGIMVIFEVFGLAVLQREWYIDFSGALVIKLNVYMYGYLFFIFFCRKYLCF